MKRRRPVRFTQPKRTLCWLCDRALYAAGRSYHEMEIDGVLRPVHQQCWRTAAHEAMGK